MNRTEEFFTEEDVVSRYTIQDAEVDGVLVNVNAIEGYVPDGMFSHITSGLLRRAQVLEEEDGRSCFNLVNLRNLLMQVYWAVKAASRDFEIRYWLYSGKIRLPNGTIEMVFIVENEQGEFTVMLPEEY